MRKLKLIKINRPTQLPTWLLPLHVHWYLLPKTNRTALNSPPKPAPPVLPISINGSSITPIAQTKILGVILDSTLSFTPHHLTLQWTKLVQGYVQNPATSHHFHCYSLLSQSLYYISLISPRLLPEPLISPCFHLCLSAPLILFSTQQSFVL